MRERILGAISEEVATHAAAAYARRRLAERMGSLSREVEAELKERAERLARVEERIRSLIVTQADGDRSPMVAQVRADFEAQARAERSAIAELKTQAEPHPIPPVDLKSARAT